MTPIKFVENGGAVSRYHAVTTLTKDTVASHSFHVAWIAALLWAELHPDRHPRGQFLLAALAHDLAEQEFGDIPAPTKRAVAAFEKMEHLENAHLSANGFGFGDNITEEESFLLKLADSLDGVRFCSHELSLGNLRLAPVRDRFIVYVEALLLKRIDLAATLRPVVATILPPPRDTRAFTSLEQS